MSPLAMLVAAANAQPVALFGLGLGCLLPPLVACEELTGPSTNGPVQALLVAVVVLGFLAQTWRASRPKHAPGLRQLWPWPRGRLEIVSAVWALVALGLAWWLPPLPTWRPTW